MCSTCSVLYSSFHTYWFTKYFIATQKLEIPINFNVVHSNLDMFLRSVEHTYSPRLSSFTFQLISTLGPGSGFKTWRLTEVPESSMILSWKLTTWSGSSWHVIWVSRSMRCEGVKVWSSIVRVVEMVTLWGVTPSSDDTSPLSNIRNDCMQGDGIACYRMGQRYIKSKSKSIQSYQYHMMVTVRLQQFLYPLSNIRLLLLALGQEALSSCITYTCTSPNSCICM